MSVLTSTVRSFAEGPNFCVLSVPLPQGGVGAWVMWIHAEGDHVVFVTAAGSVKHKAIKANPNVTLTIWRHDHPYDYVEVRGRVTGILPGDRAREMLEIVMANKYRGISYPRPDVAEWNMFLVEPDHQRAW